MMIIYMAYQVVLEANYFLVKDGVSTILSPRQLIDCRTLDFKRDLEVPFGQFVECGAPTTNTPKERTRSGIYLGLNDSLQGGYLVMSLDTGKELSTNKVNPIPVTDQVKTAVEAIAHRKGFKNLKFTN